jgi:tetratricopeptide (TPR) repeat protein
MAIFDKTGGQDSDLSLERVLKEERNPLRRSELLTTLGHWHSSLNHYDRALAYHDRALQENPKNDKAFRNKGAVYSLMGEDEKARECYNEALQLQKTVLEQRISQFRGKPQVPPARSARVCCVCGMDLKWIPAMVDRQTGEAFCEQDSRHFGLDPGQRPAHRAR